MNHHTTGVSSNAEPLAQAIALALSIGAAGAHADTFSVTTNSDSGAGSLRFAVAAANALGGADQINISGGLGTITLTSGQIDITESVTISGPAAGQTISGNNASRIFAVTEQLEPLTLENLTLTNGYAAGPFAQTCAAGTNTGGAVCSRSPLTLTNTVVTGSQTVGNFALGGGIRASDGNGISISGVTLTDSVVSGNAAIGEGASGGGISVGFLDLALINSTVSGNTTQGDLADGGGLSASKSSVSLVNSTVSDNSTTGTLADGGGLYLLLSRATLTNSIVAGNSTSGAYAKGGGMFFYDSVYDFTLTLINSILSGNFTTGDYASGGGLAALEGDLAITDSTISDNRTQGIFLNGGGAGLYLREGTATLTNSTVSGNSALAISMAGVGGMNFYNARARLNNCTVTNNRSSTNTGGIQLRGTIMAGFRLDLSSTILTNNRNLPGFVSNLNVQESGGASIAVGASFSLFGDPQSEITSTNYSNIFSNFAELATLSDNGCAEPAGAPSDAACVQTHGLTPISVALDAGANPLVLINDQRGSGFPRSLGTTDIGAFEGTAPLIFSDGFEGSP